MGHEFRIFYGNGLGFAAKRMVFGSLRAGKTVNVACFAGDGWWQSSADFAALESENEVSEGKGDDPDSTTTRD
jgi:hypothetical protein